MWNHRDRSISSELPESNDSAELEFPHSGQFNSKADPATVLKSGTSPNPPT